VRFFPQRDSFLDIGDNTLAEESLAFLAMKTRATIFMNNSA